MSVDPPEVSSDLRAGIGARWTFLCDPEREIHVQLGFRGSTDTLHQPYVPAVFVISPDRQPRPLRSSRIQRLLVLRPPHQLRSVSQRLRPDWTPATPRAAADWRSSLDRLRAQTRRRAVTLDGQPAATLDRSGTRLYCQGRFRIDPVAPVEN